MTQTRDPRRGNWSLYIAALVTYVATTTLALTRASGPELRPPYAALLAAYGLALGYSLAAEPTGRGLHLYLAVQTVLTGGLMALHVPTYSFFSILFIILSAQAMWLPSQRAGFAWIAAFTLITTFFALSSGGGLTRLTLAGLYAGSYFFFGIFSAAVARADAARQESQRLLGELQQVHDQLQEYALKAEELAVAEERNRLARELHDTLGHALTISVVQLEGAQRLIAADPERTSRIIGAVREELRGALSELRRAVATLHTPLEAELPLPQVLSRLATRFEEATRLPVHLALPAEAPALSPEYRLAFYRAAQEALTNIQRHAQAKQVWLTFSGSETGAPKSGGAGGTSDSATLIVSDDGVGLRLTGEPGFGLRGLQERAAQLGGELTVDSRRGGGTQVRFSVPLPPSRPWPDQRRDRPTAQPGRGYGEELRDQHPAKDRRSRSHPGGLARPRVGPRLSLHKNSTLDRP